MTPELIISISLVLFLGGFIQSSAGFGFGLFALPLLLFMKIPLQEAVLMVVIGSAIQKIIGIGYFRKIINIRELSPLIVSGMAGLPIGLYLMFRVSGMHNSTVKQIIGSLIILMLAFRWMNPVRPEVSIKKFWTLLAGFLAGLLNGFANIGGPPVVLWVLAQNWENRKMRSAVISFSLFFVPFQILIMTLMFGSAMVRALIFSIMLSPAVLMGSWAGLKFGDLFSKKVLERYMEILLLIIALSSVLKPFFS